MVNRIEIGTINAPELVLVQDGSDNLVIEDSDGNTIVRFNQDQTADFFGNVLPDTDGSHDLGADATRWANLFADAVTTEKASIGQVVAKASLTGSNQTISNSTFTQVNLDSNDFEDTDIVTIDLANNKITITEDGTYWVKARATWAASTSWDTGDQIITQAQDATNTAVDDQATDGHHGANEQKEQLSLGVFEVSGNTDFIIRVRHSSGVDEAIASAGAGQITHLEIVRIG